jgi:hypothetical protein
MTSSIDPLEGEQRLRVSSLAAEHDNPARALGHPHDGQQTQQRQARVNESDRAPPEEDVEEIGENDAQRHRDAVEAQQHAAVLRTRYLADINQRNSCQACKVGREKRSEWSSIIVWSAAVAGEVLAFAMSLIIIN